MEPGERRRMRERLERFRMLSPEERARILEALREASQALPPRPPLDAPGAAPAPIAPDPTPGD